MADGWKCRGNAAQDARARLAAEKDLFCRPLSRAGSRDVVVPSLPSLQIFRRLPDLISQDRRTVSVYVQSIFIVVKHLGSRGKRHSTRARPDLDRQPLLVVEKYGHLVSGLSFLRLPERSTSSDQIAGRTSSEWNIWSNREERRPDPTRPALSSQPGFRASHLGSVLRSC